MEEQIKNDVKFYDEVISLHPNHVEAYYLRGFVRYKFGLYIKAVADYDKIISLSRQYPEIYYLRGFANLRCGFRKQATDDLVRAVKVHQSPIDADAYYVRGIANTLLGRSKMANEDYEQAVRLNPDYADAYYVQSSKNTHNHIYISLDEMPLPDVVKRRVVEFYSKDKYLYRIKEKEKKEKERRQEEERIHREEKLKRDEAIDQIRGEFERDFLQADLFYGKNLSFVLPRNEYEEEKIKFVQEWISKKTSLFLDEDQARAIGTIHGNLQLVARAGSGKTSTLISRALFIIEHCGVHADELLLLAFNRKAVLEMRKRMLFLLNRSARVAFESEIKKEIADSKRLRSVPSPQDLEEKVIDIVAEKLAISLPHVMTFHALAYAIVKPEENLIYDDPQSNRLRLSRVLQQVVDEHIRGDLQSEIRELMLAHFKGHWEAIIKGGYEKDSSDFLQFRRSLPYFSLNGERIKSAGEKLIADFLFEHNISYKYRHKHWLNGTDYGPCFIVYKRVKGRGFIVKQSESYLEDHSRKPYYGKIEENWELIELSPPDFSENSFEDFTERLKNSLQQKGVQCVRLPEDEIWRRIRDRAIDRFTRAMTGFVNRCRQLSWTEEFLQERISKYCNDGKAGNGQFYEKLEGNHASRPSFVEKQFLLVARRIYSAYLVCLSEANEEDFNGLMQRAVEKIKKGHRMFTRKAIPCDLESIRYIFIDEFQDFSESFYRFVSVTKEFNENMELFCVGDDWQAINGFAGSDLIFFENFEEYFGDCHRLYMTTNYRSGQSIVEAGNALMEGLGKPASSNKDTSGTVLVADLDEFQPSILEKERYGRDLCTPAILRLVQKSLSENREIVLLSRLNEIFWPVANDDTKNPKVDNVSLNAFENAIRSYFPKELRNRISVSTVHRYKGLEKKTVVIIDSVESCYPLIHQDWIFARIFGDNFHRIALAEQRLFYVAMTRAIDELFIVTSGAERSPFLQSLVNVGYLDWSHLKPMEQKRLDIYIAKVRNRESRRPSPTYVIKDRLKKSGYKWSSEEECWWKSFPLRDFNLGKLKSEEWSRKADGVTVQIFDEKSIKCLSSYFISKGQWVHELEK